MVETNREKNNRKAVKTLIPSLKDAVISEYHYIKIEPSGQPNIIEKDGKQYVEIEAVIKIKGVANTVDSITVRKFVEMSLG